MTPSLCTNLRADLGLPPRFDVEDGRASPDEVRRWWDHLVSYGGPLVDYWQAEARGEIPALFHGEAVRAARETR
jgi:hypothetical protein